MAMLLNSIGKRNNLGGCLGCLREDGFHFGYVCSTHNTSTWQQLLSCWLYGPRAQRNDSEANGIEYIHVKQEGLGKNFGECFHLFHRVYGGLVAEQLGLKFELSHL